MASFSQTLADRGGALFHVALEGRALRVGVTLPEGRRVERLALFAAVGEGWGGGSVVTPSGQGAQGSAVFLPFRANRLLWTEGGTRHAQTWEAERWGEVRRSPGEALEVELSGAPGPVRLLFYAKAMEENGGWGRMIAVADAGAWLREQGVGDQALPAGWTLEPEAAALRPLRRGGEEPARIYQLFLRLFGDRPEPADPHAPLAEAGCGRFGDLDENALRSFAQLGFTHLWLTGIPRQATGTDYAAIGLPADDPDILKGVAGSPYAVRDAFDLCPDYARDPAGREEEFRALLARIRAAGLRAVVDLVPNHVARSHQTVVEPECEFGAGDDPSRFFDPRNDFFYLQPGPEGPPLLLPTLEPPTAACRALGGCDGRFASETERGRVSGNNAVTWRPGAGDWYETVKLNYGYDFTTAQAEYPNAQAPEKPLPKAWRKMDAVIARWQELGVDGFRCDMAHLVPPEFWAWAIGRARERQRETYFFAEAYDDDPAKVASRNPALNALYGGRGSAALALLDAGFDTVYDHAAYRALKRLYDGPGWANDLDAVATDAFLAHGLLRYAENHDEVRLGAAGEWGGVGMNVGRPVCAVLYGLSAGPVLLQGGQEVGEPGGANGRTPLFDYGVMPELARWINGGACDGGRLSPDQRALRAFYGRLLRLLGDAAFCRGNLYCLNAANARSRNFGRLPGEPCGGHWMYAFLRHDPVSARRFLVAANFHPREAFRDVEIAIPPDAAAWLGLPPNGNVTFAERLSSSPALRLTGPLGGLTLPVVPPLTPYYFEISP